MSDKLALKTLTASDLTLFESFFRSHGGAKQKAINLNAAVFVQQLFPELARVSQESESKLDVEVVIVGPGDCQAHRTASKIIKGASYKNWRLGGSTIPDPSDEHSRYANLVDGDVALLSFQGNGRPDSVVMLLASQNEEHDADVLSSFRSLLNGISMLAIRSSDIATVPIPAPFRELVTLGEQDIQVEPPVPTEQLSLTPRQLEKYNRRRWFGAVRKLLENEKDAGRIRAYEVAEADALWDFSVTAADGIESLVLVKGTNGPFETKLQITMAELIQMRDAPQRFDMYRVYEAQERFASLRVAENLAQFARRFLPLCANFPETIVPESFSVAPRILSFGDSIDVRIPAIRRKSGPTSSVDTNSTQIEKRSSTERARKEREKPPSRLGDIPRSEVMSAFRTETRGVGEISQKDLLREVARRLGFRRLGKHIRSELRGHLRAAIRRKIVAREGDQLIPATPLFRQYEDAILMKTMESVMRRGRAYSRNEITRNVACYLGFSQITESINERMRSVFDAAIQSETFSVSGESIMRH